MRQDFEDPAWAKSALRPYDSPLSARGFQQAREVGQALQGQGIQALYASPFLRALQTADAIAAALNLPIRVEPGFGEWHNPVWMAESPQLPDALAAHRLFPRVDVAYRPVGQARYPELDETQEVRARVNHTLSVLTAKQPPEHLVIVAHGSPLGQSLGLLVPGVPGIHLNVASITRIDREGSLFRLVHSGVDHLSDRHAETRFH